MTADQERESFSDCLLGQAVATLRRGKKKQQQAVARKAGIRVAVLKKLEQGEGAASADLDRIAAALRISRLDLVRQVLRDVQAELEAHSGEARRAIGSARAAVDAMGTEMARLQDVSLAAVEKSEQATQVAARLWTRRTEALAALVKVATQGDER